MKISCPCWKKHLSCLAFLCLFVSQSMAQDSIVCNELIRKGIDQMMNVKYAAAIKNLSKSREMAQLGKWPRQEFLSVNNLGLTYYKMMDYGQALAHYLEAYELAVEQKNISNEMTVLNNIAIVYIKENQIEKAEAYFLKSYTIATELNNDSRIGYYASNLAQLNMDMKRFKVAEKYCSIALSKLKREPRVLMSARIIKNALLFEDKQYRKVIRDCLQLAEEAKRNNYTDELSEIQKLLAMTYARINQPEKALAASEYGLRQTENNEVKIGLLELLAENALKLNQIDKAMASKDTIIRLTKLIHDNKNKELIENASLRFELYESKHALDNNKVVAENKQKRYLLSILVLLISLGSVLAVFYKRNQLIRQKRIIDENNLKIKNLELEQEKNTSLALQSEVALKNKLLSDKILFQTTRNERIQDIIETIANDAVLEQHASLKRMARELKLHLKEDTQWDDFTAHFENVNNDFLAALKSKHADLNANDIRFLSFIYLHLNTKEIASLLNISPESCRKRKERLIKKLKCDPEVSLYCYLSRIV